MFTTQADMLAVLSRLFPGRGGPLAVVTLKEMFSDKRPPHLVRSVPAERADSGVRLWISGRGNAAALH